jgi:hypothetical protein
MNICHRKCEWRYKKQSSSLICRYCDLFVLIKNPNVYPNVHSNVQMQLDDDANDEESTELPINQQELDLILNNVNHRLIELDEESDENPSLMMGGLYVALKEAIENHTEHLINKSKEIIYKRIEVARAELQDLKIKLDLKINTFEAGSAKANYLLNESIVGRLNQLDKKLAELNKKADEIAIVQMKFKQIEEKINKLDEKVSSVQMIAKLEGLNRINDSGISLSKLALNTTSLSLNHSATIQLNNTNEKISKAISLFSKTSTILSYKRKKCSLFGYYRRLFRNRKVFKDIGKIVLKETEKNNEQFLKKQTQTRNNSLKLNGSNVDLLKYFFKKKICNDDRALMCIRRKTKKLQSNSSALPSCATNKKESSLNVHNQEVNKTNFLESNSSTEKIIEVKNYPKSNTSTNDIFNLFGLRLKSSCFKVKRRKLNGGTLNKSNENEKPKKVNTNEIIEISTTTTSTSTRTNMTSTKNQTAENFDFKNNLTNSSLNEQSLKSISNVSVNSIETKPESANQTVIPSLLNSTDTQANASTSSIEPATTILQPEPKRESSSTITKPKPAECKTKHQTGKKNHFFLEKKSHYFHI